MSIPWGRPPTNRNEIRQRYRESRLKPREILEESIIFRSTSMGIQPYGVTEDGQIIDINSLPVGKIESYIVGALHQIPLLYDTITSMLYPLDTEIELAKRPAQKKTLDDFRRAVFDRRSELSITYADTTLALFSAYLSSNKIQKPEAKLYHVHDVIERSEAFANKSSMRLVMRGYTLIDGRWTKAKLYEVPMDLRTSDERMHP